MVGVGDGVPAGLGLGVVGVGDGVPAGVGLGVVGVGVGVVGVGLGVVGVGVGVVGVGVGVVGVGVPLVGVLLGVGTVLCLDLTTPPPFLPYPILLNLPANIAAPNLPKAPKPLPTANSSPAPRATSFTASPAVYRFPGALKFWATSCGKSACTPGATCILLVFDLVLKSLPGPSGLAV